MPCYPWSREVCLVDVLQSFIHVQYTLCYEPLVDIYHHIDPACNA